MRVLENGIGFGSSLKWRKGILGRLMDVKGQGCARCKLSLVAFQVSVSLLYQQVCCECNPYTLSKIQTFVILTRLAFISPFWCQHQVGSGP